MKALFMSLLIFLYLLGFAQEPKDEVKAVVNKLFKAMQDADSAGAKSVFMPEAIMQTIIKGQGKQSIVRQESVSWFASSVGAQKPGALNEVIEFETIKIELPLAFVWTPYQFFLNGAFSHRGVNAFCLVHSPTGWKIQYVIDTRMK